MKKISHWHLLLACGLLAPLAIADSAMNFRVELMGEQEVPPAVTLATGTAILHVDQQQSQIRYDLEIRDGNNILGVAGAHLHCAPEGENGPVIIFLAGASNPGFDGRVKISAALSDDSFVNTETVCGDSIAQLVESILEGNVYINVHSPAFPAGEIRGQIR